MEKVAIRYNAGSSNNRIEGGSDNDTINTGSGNDKIDCGLGNDTISGNFGKGGILQGSTDGDLSAEFEIRLARAP